ncbi:uncharacterized protein LOC108095947 isoform X2 [Drosophila ficusphila]|uniref:uncharacterized protein LOC108095947 isoform X2 n=1 Tax=Drosophila ficusphila TaxID=30025 RepID=UPI0007E5C14D|nr:uncharacterized protein LOC108095947 isoform X2 [Drosophila ficusphila]
MFVDLKKLLKTCSMIPAGEVIRRHKRFKCGKASYVVHYELQNGELHISHMRKIRRTPTLRSQLQKRLLCVKRRLSSGKGLGPKPSVTCEDKTTQTFLNKDVTSKIEMKLESTASQTEEQEFIDFKPQVKCVDGFTQATLFNKGSTVMVENSSSQTPHLEWSSCQVDTSDLLETIPKDQLIYKPIQQTSTIAVGTEVKLKNTSSQTKHQEWISTQVDTSDLILTHSRDQQTLNPGQQSLSSQTEQQIFKNCSTQAEVNAKCRATQTKLVRNCLGTQTGVYCSSAVVQTDTDCQHSNTQTCDDEEELIKPHLNALYLIYDSIKNQSELIHNEVLDAVNQLTDLTLLSVKNKCLKEDLPREATLEPLTPCAENQFGDNLPKEKLLSEAELKKVLLKYGTNRFFQRKNKLQN